MTNPRIKAILREVFQEGQQDKRFEKITLIDDIIRIKKHMWSLGLHEHDEFLTESSATKLFDTLYDMDIQQLELINSGYEKQVNDIMSKRIKIAM